MTTTDTGSRTRTVHFEDCGQDFLEWDLDSSGTVVDSRPFQYSIWVGLTVTGVKVGKRPTISGKDLERPLKLLYRIVRIVDAAAPVAPSQDRSPPS